MVSENESELLWIFPFKVKLFRLSSRIFKVRRSFKRMKERSCTEDCRRNQMKLLKTKVNYFTHPIYKDSQIGQVNFCISKDI